MSFEKGRFKKYLPILAVMFGLFLMGASVQDTGLRDLINLNFIEDSRKYQDDVLDLLGNKECGDGLVQGSEVCDPPGSTKRNPGGSQCGQGEIQVEQCSKNCNQWKTSCEPESTCGNGIVESGENCDDGSLNGTYGHCKKDCSGPFDKYCGDGKLNTDSNGNPLEACDTVGGACTGANGKTASDPKPCSTYATSSLNSCAADCQSRGNYCGDGIRQRPHEECDDGNDDNGDKCKNDCTLNENKVNPEAEPQCGNGIVDEDEACDQGDRNGKKCTPEYGQSCTYCSADCQNVLTIDTTNFCGNAKLDQFKTDQKGRPIYESCDVNSQGEVLAPIGYQSESGGWIATEIAFVLDDTGSMGPYITDLKNNVKSFLSEQKSASAGVVTFKDSAEMDRNFSTDFEEVKNTISNIQATGGGDPNECVSCGISTAMKSLNWHDRTKKVMIVASLAGAHDCDRLENLANSAAGKNIKIYTATKDADRGCETELTQNVPNITDAKNFDLEADWNETLGVIAEDIDPQTAKVISCPDKGNYSCANQCKNLQNECIECNTYKGRDVTPKISVLNPMIVSDSRNSYPDSSPGNQFRDWGERKSDPPPNNNWHKDMFMRLHLVRPEAPQDDSIEYYKSLGEIDYTNQEGAKKRLTKLGRKRYVLKQKLGGVKPPEKYTPLFFDDQKALQSDRQCNSEYKVLFHPEDPDATTSSYEGGVSNFYSKIEDSYKNQAGELKSRTSKGDLFDYPVKGESGQIKNSVITSPAVPPGTMRIVVEWTNNESRKFGTNKRGKLIGELYSQKLDPSRISYEQSEKNNPYGICNQIELSNEDVWAPRNCNDYENGDSVVSVHDIGGTKDFSKNLQSMTVSNIDQAESNGNSLEEGEQVAFYVKAMGKPIQGFQNSNLKVSIYTYRNNQNSEYSIYKPTYQFKISSSTHSGNPIAPYWHAFNIMKVNCPNKNTWAITDRKGNIITPGHSSHGKVISRFNDIKKTTKSKVNNPNCSELSELDYYNDSSQIIYSNTGVSGGTDFNYFSNFKFNIFLNDSFNTNFNIN